LGIANIVFISILTGKLPKEQQRKGRIFGLAFALITRILLLLSITWVMTLTQPLFNVADWFNIHDADWHHRLEISGRDLILIIGGFFLLYKSIVEIHGSLEGIKTIIQIGLLDIVFGLDSVITAIGMAEDVNVMIAAVVVSMVFMVFAAQPVGDFVNKHPSIKMLALSFLILIGISLMAEGIERPIAKSNIYFAMGFSIFVEILVIRMSKGKKEDPVQLKRMINEEYIER
jgi:predicted tellurium resistance membrane protein TerC